MPEINFYFGDEFRTHMHFCEECQTNWRHAESPECYYVDDKTCPEHEE